MDLPLLDFLEYVWQYACAAAAIRGAKPPGFDVLEYLLQKAPLENRSNAEVAAVLEDYSAERRVLVLRTKPLPELLEEVSGTNILFAPTRPVYGLFDEFLRSDALRAWQTSRAPFQKAFEKEVQKKLEKRLGATEPILFLGAVIIGVDKGRVWVGLRDDVETFLGLNPAERARALQTPDSQWSWQFRNLQVRDRKDELAILESLAFLTTCGIDPIPRSLARWCSRVRFGREEAWFLPALRSLGEQGWLSFDDENIVPVPVCSTPEILGLWRNVLDERFQEFVTCIIDHRAEVGMWNLIRRGLFAAYDRGGWEAEARSFVHRLIDRFPTEQGVLFAGAVRLLHDREGTVGDWCAEEYTKLTDVDSAWWHRANVYLRRGNQLACLRYLRRYISLPAPIHAREFRSRIFGAFQLLTLPTWPTSAWRLLWEILTARYTEERAMQVLAEHMASVKMMDEPVSPASWARRFEEARNDPTGVRELEDEYLAQEVQTLVSLRMSGKLPPAVAREWGKEWEGFWFLLDSLAAAATDDWKGCLEALGRACTLFPSLRRRISQIQVTGAVAAVQLKDVSLLLPLVETSADSATGDSTVKFCHAVESLAQSSTRSAQADLRVIADLPNVSPADRHRAQFFLGIANDLSAKDSKRRRSASRKESHKGKS